jgi:putative ABC transport system ATP-binding protein
MKLELQNLSLQYNGKPPLFQNVNLTVNTGEFVVIQGPSGIGKSSLLRLLNRLQEPTSGTILIDDKPITEHEVTHLRRRIGYVQQTPITIEGSVRDNLLLPFAVKAADGASSPNDDDLRKKLDAYLLTEVQLDDNATELSVGQKQRIALIRILLIAPNLMICDEPTSALDPESRTVVERELERINRETQTSVILITHVDFTPENLTPITYVLTPNGLQ